MNPANDPGISGKKLLPMLGTGCLVFCVVLGFGTYFIAQWTTPFFEKLNKDRQPPAGASAPRPTERAAPSVLN